MTYGDLRGWKFAKDLSRVSRLTGKPDTSVVALCWLDGIFGDDEDAVERALYVLDASGETTLVAIGALPDVMISNPALKNSPVPPLPPQTPPAPDATIPIGQFGPKEQAAIAAIRDAKSPVTIPDEANPGPKPKPEAPPDIPRRKLSEVLAEVAAQAKPNAYQPSDQPPDASTKRPPKRNQTPPPTTTTVVASTANAGTK